MARLLARAVAPAVVFAVLLSGALADDDHAESASKLTKSDFASRIASKPHFVMFFAPWCGHCKNLAPTWQDLAKKYNEDEDEEVTVATVDCTVETALCSDESVTGYPTLKFYRDGKEGVKHRGQRNLDGLIEFVDLQMGRKKPEQEELLAEPEVAVEEDGLYVLTEKSFVGHVAKGDHFIKFYAPWCGHCKKLAPTWKELASAVAKDDLLTAKIAQIDCTKSQSICQDNNVKGYPTLHYFRDGKILETYKGARNLKDLSDYVHSVNKDGKGEGKTLEAGDSAVKDTVLVLNSESFEDGVKSGIAFVKFYAPWCGHCKRLAPTWQQLSEEFADRKDVKIAKVDCTAENDKNRPLCDSNGVKGFPTLKIFVNGENREEYNGKRDLEEMKKFVESHAEKLRDEL